MSEPQPAPEKAPEAPSIKDILAQDKPRRDEIKAIGARFKLAEKEVSKAIEDGTDLEQFRAHVLENFDAQAFSPVPNPDKLDASGSVGSPEAKNYSVFKAIKEMRANGSVSGLEKEVQDELSQRYRNATGDVPSGLLIPGEWLSANASGGIRNAATVGTGTSGGNTVATEMQSLTDYLKDYSILPTVGASIFRDSEGNLEFPRSTAGYSGSWDAETDTIANADAVFAANLTLSPKRVGAGTAISKQLLAQSSTDFESWVRGELLYAIGSAVDRAAITGTGASDQPTGLLSASGTGSYTWVTGTSAWENIIAQWKVLRAANCPMRSVAWLFDENVRADWSGTPKVANASAFIYEQVGNAMSGSVYGFPAYDHTDMTANKVVVGDFSQLVLAQWGGIELVVDPYSKKTSGQVELYAQTFADVGVRQPGAFVIGNDGTDHAGAIA
jgi:HK97 family phage major capsid protein